MTRAKDVVIAAAAPTPTDAATSSGATSADERPARHLRLVRPPDPDPPGAAPSTGRPSLRDVTGETPVQGTLALLFTLPGGAPAVPLARRTLRLASYRPGPDGEAPEERVPTPRADLPDPRHWTARLVQASVEAREGDRPIAQLLRCTTREVYDHLTRDAARTRATAQVRRRTTRPVVRSLHLHEPADGVVEACAVVEVGVRSRAVALRLEGLDGRWLCTELSVL